MSSSNQALQTVEDASKEAESPAVKSILDRIYGILEATKEQRQPVHCEHSEVECITGEFVMQLTIHDN